MFQRLCLFLVLILISSFVSQISLNCLVLKKFLQYFYLWSLSGIILPGQTISIPFVFQSGNAGIFTEQWCLKTHPVLCGGRRILVNLHAVATRPNELEKERQQLEVSFLFFSLKTC